MIRHVTASGSFLEVGVKKLDTVFSTGLSFRTDKVIGSRCMTRYVLVVVDSTFRFLSGGGERDCPLSAPDIAIYF